MAIAYRLVLLAVFIIAQETFQEESAANLQATHTTSTTPEPVESDEIDATAEASLLAPFEWTSQTGQVSESRRRRPDKGWGALAPVLLAASSVLPLLLTGLATLAGKALMSSILALAVAGFNLFRATQTPANNGF